MVKAKSCPATVVALLLLAGVSLLAAGCFGGGGDGVTPDNTIVTSQSDLGAASTTLVPGLASVDAEELSTFKSKDPFIPQGVVVTTTPGSEGGNTTTTQQTTTSSLGNFTTTTRSGGSGTTTTTNPGSSTTTVPAATTTTAPHLHTLKILSVGDVGGAAAVTFKVDNSVYKDRRVGDVASTSWGQIKVLDLSSSSRVATLLHESETLVLAVGQVVYE